MRRFNRRLSYREFFEAKILFDALLRFPPSLFFLDNI
jgi:hypothetical protein